MAKRVTLFSEVYLWLGKGRREYIGVCQLLVMRTIKVSELKFLNLTYGMIRNAIVMVINSKNTIPCSSGQIIS